MRERRCSASSSGTSAIAREGQCGAGRHRPHAPHPPVGHAARRPLRRGDRGDLRPRARAPRLRDIWSALALEVIVDDAGLLCRRRTCSRGLRCSLGLAGKADVAGLPLLALSGGAVSLAAARPRQRAVARPRAACRPLCAGDDEELSCLHQRDETSCRDQPGGGAPVTARRDAVPYAPVHGRANRRGKSVGSWLLEQLEREPGASQPESLRARPRSPTQCRRP